MRVLELQRRGVPVIFHENTKIAGFRQSFRASRRRCGPGSSIKNVPGLIQASTNCDPNTISAASAATGPAPAIVPTAVVPTTDEPAAVPVPALPMADGGVLEKIQ